MEAVVPGDQPWTSPQELCRPGRLPLILWLTSYPHSASSGTAPVFRLPRCAQSVLLGHRSSIISRMRLAFSIASLMAHSRAGHGLAPRVKAATLLHFAVYLKLPCCSPAMHCHPAGNARECASLVSVDAYGHYSAHSGESAASGR